MLSLRYSFAQNIHDAIILNEGDGDGSGDSNDDNNTENNNKQTNKILEIFRYTKTQQNSRFFEFLTQRHTNQRTNKKKNNKMQLKITSISREDFFFFVEKIKTQAKKN